MLDGWHVSMLVTTMNLVLQGLGASSFSFGSSMLFYLELEIWWCVSSWIKRPRITSGLWTLGKSNLKPPLPSTTFIRSYRSNDVWPSWDRWLRCLRDSRTSGIWEALPLRSMTPCWFWDQWSTISSGVQASTLWNFYALLTSKISKLIFPNAWINCHLSPLRLTTHDRFETLTLFIVLYFVQLWNYEYPGAANPIFIGDPHRRKMDSPSTCDSSPK